jgi:enoyl-CoA hydratase/carnithine racemase
MGREAMLPMPYQMVILQVKEHIAHLTLNRPERLNALTPLLEEELGVAIQEVAKNDDARVLIVTGAGKAFCAGADLEGLAGGKEKTSYNSGHPEEVRRGFSRAQATILGLQRLEKPSIAMVNGPAVGGGFDIACACDIRIGSPRARFMSAFVKLGLFPGWGGTWLYPRVLGLGKAAELLFTGDFLEAEEAYRIGFLNKLVPDEQLEAATMELAAKIAKGPPIAIRLAKLQLYKGLEMDLETAMQVAAAMEAITLTSHDHREGVAAFKEKREAKFEGR